MEFSGTASFPKSLGWKKQTSNQPSQEIDLWVMLCEMKWLFTVYRPD
jgi:hypothetical protein